MSSTPTGGFPRALVQRFSQLELTRQFALAGGVVALVAMLAIGVWLTSMVRADSIADTAANTARFMDSFIAPLAQELQSQESFSIGPIRALDEVLDTPELKDRVVSVKIWKPDGRIAYARDTALIGKTFPATDGLRGALAGRTVAELEELDEDESREEAATGIPLLEIYSPIRAQWTGEVIGVAEFYENAVALEQRLDRTMMQGWLAIAGVTALICLSLYGIVHRGGRTIAEQRAALALRAAESERAAEQNRALRQQVERASRRLAELAEQNLRRVGADLHDGPVQLISLVRLRLDALRRSRAKDKDKAFDEVASALDAALGEIREISRGLVLPELDGLTLPQVIERAVSAHEKRTPARIGRDINLADAPTSEAVKICVYRFLQESLTNAYRHGGDAPASVEANLTGRWVRVTVRNPVAAEAGDEGIGGAGIGLSGLRQRVESLGGVFLFKRTATEAVTGMRLDIESEAPHE